MMDHQPLFQCLQRPRLFETGPWPFWNDPYISAQMLQFHLAPDTDGASRKHAFIRRSAEWIAALASDPHGKNLLDLGCGPGLYTRIFQEQGFRVRGIDYSTRSIDYARTHSSTEIDYVCGNYLEWNFPGDQDVITMIYCDFGVLSPADRRLLLAKAFAALKPGGMLVFDVATEAAFPDKKDRGELEQHPEGGFWSPRNHFCLTMHRYYQKDSTFLRQYAIVSEDDSRYYYLWDHLFTAAELQNDLAVAGFRRVSLAGDIAGTPLGETDGATLAAAAWK